MQMIQVFVPWQSCTNSAWFLISLNLSLRICWQIKNNYWRWSTCLVSSDISMEEISRGVTTTIPLQSSKHWPSLKKTSVRDDGIRAGELEKLAGSGWEAELGAPPKSSYCSGKPDASLPFLFISGQRDASIKLWQLSNKDFGGIAI